jgi:hypothetical protein
MTSTNRRSSRLAVRAASAAALLFALAGATSARAADAKQEERMPRSYAAIAKMKPTEVMHLMDQGNKGYVTREEFMKFHEQLFQQLDRDRNSRITEPEFTDRG